MRFVILCYLLREFLHFGHVIFFCESISKSFANNGTRITSICKIKCIYILDHHIGCGASRIEDISLTLLFNVVFIYYTERLFYGFIHIIREFFLL